MEKCLNKYYKHTESDEFYEDYLEAIGLSFLNRKLAKTIPSKTQLIKIGECEYAINTIIPFQTQQQNFVPGVECDAMTLDGRKIRNLFVFDGMTLTEQQIEPNRKVTITRHFSEEELIVELAVGNVICKCRNEAVE